MITRFTKYYKHYVRKKTFFTTVNCQEMVKNKINAPPRPFWEINTYFLEVLVANQLNEKVHRNE